MSDKKNLLNESQIRQFMKLASLTPLTPGFVRGLTERTAEEIEESHGNGANETNRTNDGTGRQRNRAGVLPEAEATTLRADRPKRTPRLTPTSKSPTPRWHPKLVQKKVE